MDNIETLKDLSYLFTNHASKNIAFRDFTKSDVFPLFNATRHEEFTKYLPWSAPNSVEEFIPEVEKLIQERNRNQSLSLSICEKVSGTWFGFVKFTPYTDFFEISFWVHPNYWASFFVKEAAHSCVEVYFLNKEVQTLYSRIKKGNAKIIKILNFLKFSEIGEGNLMHQNGNDVFYNVFAINKDIWNSKKIAFSY